jgi:hypothetical protein
VNLTAVLPGAAVGATTGTYYPHHLGTVPTYVIAGALVVVALLIIRKLMGLAILLVVAAVALTLYHHGVLNQWLKVGEKKYHQVQVQLNTKNP